MGKQPGKKGILYVVATPIGNLDDITARAVRVLSDVNLIAAEDTRLSRRLAGRYGVRTPMVPYHDHNERRQAATLVARLGAGKDIALICDAGTPLISDAGYRLVRLAQDRGCEVVSVPGPCAAVAALSVSGLPTDRFVFEGFLPAKSPQRRRRLGTVQNDPRTLIFYESVHRLMATLRDMVAVFGGDREAVVAREITKQFEGVRRGTLNDLLEWLASDPGLRRGEFVVLIRGRDAAATPAADVERVLSILLEQLPLKQSASLAGKICGLSANAAYQRGLKLKTQR